MRRWSIPTNVHELDQQGYEVDEEIWDLNREKDHLLFGRNLMYQLAVSHQYMDDEKAKEGKGRSIRSSFRVHELRRQTFIPYLAHVGYPHRQNSVPSLRCSFQYHQQHLQTLLLVCCTYHKLFNPAVATYWAWIPLSSSWYWSLYFKPEKSIRLPGKTYRPFLCRAIKSSSSK